MSLPLASQPVEWTPEWVACARGGMGSPRSDQGRLSRWGLSCMEPSLARPGAQRAAGHALSLLPHLRPEQGDPIVLTPGDS